MNFETLDSVYFLGIGGIGMSALARYFHSKGLTVGGYDKTSTPLTTELSELGMKIHFDDTIEHIPSEFLNSEKTLVVRTPAVPELHSELNYFIEKGFAVKKRAEVLGLIFNSGKGIAIAGTHGKTSVTTFTAFVLKECGVDCSAFLGGISKNFNNNLVLGNSEYIVAEADEFDRSFLQLYPQISLVTTIDSDHLDIYNSFDNINKAFSEFIAQTHESGIVILKYGVELNNIKTKNVFTYSLDNSQSDFFASEIRIENGTYTFTLNTPEGSFSGFSINVLGYTNIENAVAATAIAVSLGVEIEKIKKAIPGFLGVERRFDIQYKDEKVVYIDDYAHHPRELDAIISSVKNFYKDRKITGIFQPHLFTRTRDFADEFAESLSHLDELILLDIYPAREKPLPGVTSEMLLDIISMDKKHYCSKENLLRKIKELNIDVLLTIGAGDIDQFILPIKNLLTEI